MSAGSAGDGWITWVGESTMPHWAIRCRVAFATRKMLTAKAAAKGRDKSTMAGANHMAGAEVRKEKRAVDGRSASETTK